MAENEHNATFKPDINRFGTSIYIFGKQSLKKATDSFTDYTVIFLIGQIQNRA